MAATEKKRNLPTQVLLLNHTLIYREGGLYLNVVEVFIQEFANLLTRASRRFIKLVKLCLIRTLPILRIMLFNYLLLLNVRPFYLVEE